MVTTTDIAEAARLASTPTGWSGHLNALLDLRVLRPTVVGRHHPVRWDAADLADARVIGAWRDVAGTQTGESGSPGAARIIRAVLDAWRDAGRPAGWVGTADGVPRVWADAGQVAAEVAGGAAVVAVGAVP